MLLHDYSLAAAVVIAILVAAGGYLFLLLSRARSREARQQETIDYLGGIVDSANEGIYVTDLKRRFLMWNSAAERIAGYKKEDVLGRYCHDNILRHTDRRNNEICFSRCPLNSAVETGATFGPEIIFLRNKSGDRIPVEVKTAPLRNRSGEIIGGVETFEDVTARLERELLLQVRTDKLETVLNNIGDGILFLDTKGNIAVFNRASAGLFGLSGSHLGSALDSLPPELPLRKALDVVDGELCRHDDGETASACARSNERLRCWTLRAEAVESGDGSACFICTAFLKRKAFLEKPRELPWKDRIFSVRSSFLELRGKHASWEIIVFRDVTAEKLDAAVKVAGAAAHELRQPLQVVLLLEALFRRELGGDKTLLPFVDALSTSCRRINTIIQQMGKLASYHTKDYVDGEKILDIDRSCETTLDV
jgi:PAS domain S-box-containing protein